MIVIYSDICARQLTEAADQEERLIQGSAACLNENRGNPKSATHGVRSVIICRQVIKRRQQHPPLEEVQTIPSYSARSHHNAIFHLSSSSGPMWEPFFFGVQGHRALVWSTFWHWVPNSWTEIKFSRIIQLLENFWVHEKLCASRSLCPFVPTRTEHSMRSAKINYKEASEILIARSVAAIENEFQETSRNRCLTFKIIN